MVCGGGGAGEDDAVVGVVFLPLLEECDGGDGFSDTDGVEPDGAVQ